MPVDTLVMSNDLKQQILQDCCSRNCQAELTCTTDSQSTLRAKIRFLELTPHGLILDQPTILGKPLHLQKDESVYVQFTWEQQPFAFVSQVQTRLNWTLNDSITIDALQVVVPQELTQTQRRQCYRLPTAHLSSARVTLHSVDKPGQTITGTITDISEGGTSILTEANVIQKIAIDDAYEASFSLPDENRKAMPYKFLGIVCRVQKIPDSRRLKIAIAWHPDHKKRNTSSPLGRFIIAEQLRMLRRSSKLNN
ncbi:MAG: PilZ domain-containing protein [Planctomycetota bacterium]|nr:MAG: PilZ domain-containing protein [Planctomycetota bacterium]